MAMWSRLGSEVLQLAGGRKLFATEQWSHDIEYFDAREFGRRGIRTKYILFHEDAHLNAQDTSILE